MSVTFINTPHEKIETLRVNCKVLAAQRDTHRAEAAHYKEQLEAVLEEAWKGWKYPSEQPRRGMQVLIITRDYEYIAGKFKQGCVELSAGGALRLVKWEDVMRWRYLPDARKSYEHYDDIAQQTITLDLDLDPNEFKRRLEEGKENA